MEDGSGSDNDRQPTTPRPSSDSASTYSESHPFLHQDSTPTDRRPADDDGFRTAQRYQPPLRRSTRASKPSLKALEARETALPYDVRGSLSGF